MQTLLVILTFLLAAGFLLNKFVGIPFLKGKQNKSKSIDGSNTKCGKNDCGCH